MSDAGSLDGYLEALESDELLHLADELSLLRESRAWKQLEAMVELMRGSARRELEARVLDQATYAHRGGKLAGSRWAGDVIERVVAKADRLRDI